jgi:hypothetical protein
VDDDAAAIGWLSDVTLSGSDEPIRVVLLRREGNRVIVRQVDPCDPEPDRIPLFEGDELVVAEAISHVSLNTNDTTGDTSGFLFGMRVVEVDRLDGVVRARTLRHGEADTGARVHVAPGESMTFDEGAMVVDLDFLDGLQPPTESGYAELTPVLATWFSVGEHDEAEVRYLLAAARRLDVANRRMVEIEDCRSALSREGLAGPEIRRRFFQLIGAVESAIIALYRAVYMVQKASDLIGASHTVPPDVARMSSTINEIRKAYEHIEDRAVGTEFGRAHPDALTIFDYSELLKHDVIMYGAHRLSLTVDVPNVIRQVREFIKVVAGH